VDNWEASRRSKRERTIAVLAVLLVMLAGGTLWRVQGVWWFGDDEPLPVIPGVELPGERECVTIPDPIASAISEQSTPAGGRVIVVPDPQYATERNPAQLYAQMRYIISRRPDLVVFVGDLVDVAQSRPQWEVVARATQMLTDAGVVWIPAEGNHDATADRRTLMNEFLAPGAWIGGTYPAGGLENSWSLVRVGGRRWLILSLEYYPRNAVIEWAGSVAAAHTDVPMILVTHAYLSPHGYLDNILHRHIQARCQGWTPSEGCNTGREILAKLVLRHSNIKLVLCGHLDGGRLARSIRRADGTVVHQLLQDYQDDPANGRSWTREMQFNYEAGSIRVDTFSPLLGHESQSPGDAFSISL
jgi:hypothetical protein